MDGPGNLLPKGGEGELSRRIGPYRLDVLLGRGGMGEVYKAWDERLERWVAVKHLLAAGNAGSRARLRREAKIAAGLGHPAILQIFDIPEASAKSNASPVRCRSWYSTSSRTCSAARPSKRAPGWEPCWRPPCNAGPESTLLFAAGSWSTARSFTARPLPGSPTSCSRPRPADRTANRASMLCPTISRARNVSAA